MQILKDQPFLLIFRNTMGALVGEQGPGDETLLLFLEVTAGSHRILSRPAVILGLKRHPTARQV